jgi:hypothetical protein
MRLLALIRDELWGLFVDDGIFAGAIVIWLLLGWGVLPRLGLSSGLPAVILFAGLAAILVMGSLRGARKRRG